MGLTADQRAETLELIELAQRRHDEHFFANIWPRLENSHVLKCPIGRRMRLTVALAVGAGLGAGGAMGAAVVKLLAMTVG